MYTRMQEVKNVHQPDILILGSSHAYRGFDVRIFEQAGYKTFNMGSSSQTPVQTLLLLKRYLNDINPGFVIFEVSPDVLASDGVESAVDVIANDKNDFRSLLMAFKINNVKVYNTLLYAFMNDLFNVNKNFEEPLVKPKRKDTYIPGGYVEKKMKYYTSKTKPKKTFEFKDMQLEAFKKNIADLKREKIEYILVYTPVANDLYTSFTNVETFDSIMHTHGDYYNFNEIMQLTDTLHFYDSQHLNQTGVREFNNRLLTLLKANDY
ncbi:MAG: hypothetical protein U9Q98_06230 [Bacteroidota bacterium]|nr:hypothetical protein [Bacteroidota bacterium]